MDILLQGIKQRRSVRQFTNRVPAEALLYELIEYAVLAPNAMNRQDWRFNIILSKEVQNRILSAVEKKWETALDGRSGIDDLIKLYSGNFSTFINAPVLIVADIRTPPDFLVSSFGENASKILGSYASACMAVQNLLLAAHAKGLGACVYSGVMAAEEEIKQITGVTGKRELACLIAVGYPDEHPDMPIRKDVAKVVRMVEG